MATTTERRQQLLQRLLVVEDEQVLGDIEAILDKRCPDDVLYFSSELRNKVDNALEQMKQGKTFTTEEMERRMSRWSGL